MAPALEEIDGDPGTQLPTRRREDKDSRRWRGGSDWHVHAGKSRGVRRRFPLPDALSARNDGMHVGGCRKSAPMNTRNDAPAGARNHRQADIIPGLLDVPGLSFRPLSRRPIDDDDAWIKFLMDRGLGLVLALTFLPLGLLAALAVRLETPGPVLYRQRRHGLDNREFLIFKFRTMAWRESTCFEQTRRNDQRVTRVGRLLRATSIDELPQLLNVLRGEMSLVGPRPHAVDMRTAGLTGPEITSRYAERHRVKPGMTGWAQVNGSRGATTEPAQIEQRVSLDLHYIDHWSPWMDLLILARTPLAVARATNAY